MPARPRESSKTGLKRKTFQRIKRAHDLETHVSRVTLAGEKLVEVRDYVPSLKEYGRGTTIPAEHLQQLLDGLVDIRDEETTDA